MALSPLEIRNQDFGKSPWGYKKDEVKFFLSQAAETVAEIAKERDQLSRRVEGLLKRVSELEAKSSAIGEALEHAKKEAGEIVEAGREEARKIRESADDEAQKVMDQYAAQINETKQELYELTTIKDSYFRKLLRVLELQEEAIKRFDEEYEARRVKDSVEALADGFQLERHLPDREVFSSSIHRRRRSSLFSEK